MYQRIICLIVICLIMDTFYVQACPPLPENGQTWDKDDKEGPRCILRCKKGYSPSGCHVIRREGGNWNKDIPKCEKDGSTTAKVLYYVAIGCAAAVGAPYALAAAGFGASGVVAGSLAAAAQSAGMTGPLFSAAQSAGAAGLSVLTKLGIASKAAGATKFAEEAAGYLFCEQE